MIGGAPTTRAWADEIGADGYAEDAIEAAPRESILGASCAAGTAATSGTARRRAAARKRGRRPVAAVGSLRPDAAREVCKRVVIR